MTLLLLAIFVGLRVGHTLADRPSPSPITTARLVVVGIPGRYAPTAADRAVLAAHRDDAAVGAVAIRPRYVGDCAAAGWLTLGAGRRTTVGGRCAPAVAESRVVDWGGYLTAAAANHGDAKLGTLAATVAGCVEAVGPGAALAAAGPDGRLDRYRTAEQFRAEQFSPQCPLTLVDAGGSPDDVIAAVSQQPDTAVIVTGIGPAAGSRDPGLQLVYRLRGPVAGWLTSSSTRREGVITLTDLTRTVVSFGQSGRQAGVPVDGAELMVHPADVTYAEYSAHLRAVAALSDTLPRAYLGFGLAGSVLFGVLIAALISGRLRLSRLILVLSTSFGAAMMLTGTVPWQESSRPTTVLLGALAAWCLLITFASLQLSRRLAVSPAIVAAGLTVAAFTADATMGGVLQPGSMLNSRPVAALRWYGFGNVTFGAYAVAGLTLAGYVAARLLELGRRTAAVVAAAAIGFGVVVCQGWPSMGSDFGGVIALTPPLLWLLLRVSGRRATALRLVAVGGCAAVAIGIISTLDWLRGPGQRSHLGDFVQRIVDGDAAQVVIRKGLASADTILSPGGLASLLIGGVLWLLIFRFALPVLIPTFPTLRLVAWAVLATAALGTLLNDGGISVLIAASGSFAFTVASLWVDRAEAEGQLSWAGSAHR